MTARLPRHERGAALVAVLAMLLLLSGLAALGLSRLQAATDRVSDADAQARANRLAEAGIGAAMPMANRLKARDAQARAMLGTRIRIDLAGGTVILRFRDGGGCFNLNSLARQEGAERADSSVRDFARLLAAAGMAPLDADRIASATANRLAAGGILWADPSEWVLVPGVTGAMWQQMAPLLCTLPTREPSTFNVNALTIEQAPLLVAIGLSPEAARAAIARRPAGGWQSANDFWGAAVPAGAPANAGAAATGISSRWIRVDLYALTPEASAGRSVLLDTIRAPATVAATVWLPPPTQAEAADMLRQEGQG